MKCLLLKNILALGLTICTDNDMKFVSAAPMQNATDLIVVCRGSVRNIDFIIKDYFKNNQCITINK